MDNVAYDVQYVPLPQAPSNMIEPIEPIKRTVRPVKLEVARRRKMTEHIGEKNRDVKKFVCL